MIRRSLVASASEFPVLTSERKKSIIFSSPAGVAKLVYALDSKSSGLNAHVGSTPTLGTTHFFDTSLNSKVFDTKRAQTRLSLLPQLTNYGWQKRSASIVKTTSSQNRSSWGDSNHT